MPFYTYQIVTPTGDGPILDLYQCLGDKPLTHHPETGAPLRKVITAPNLPLKHGDQATKAILSDTNLSRQGFTKYVREEKGHYVKTAGDAAAPGELRA